MHEPRPWVPHETPCEKEHSYLPPFPTSEAKNEPPPHVEELPNLALQWSRGEHVWFPRFLHLDGNVGP